MQGNTPGDMHPGLAMNGKYVHNMVGVFLYRYMTRMGDTNAEWEELTLRQVMTTVTQNITQPLLDYGSKNILIGSHISIKCTFQRCCSALMVSGWRVAYTRNTWRQVALKL